MSFIKFLISIMIACFLLGVLMGILVLNVFVLNKTYESTLCFNSDCFTVEHAESAKKQERGLMGRDYLDQDKGMLFIFKNEGVRSFWMKDMLIPLDIVWIDANGTVVYIAENMQSCKTVLCKSVVPDAKAKYVLELNAGVVNRINLTIGDQASLS